MQNFSLCISAVSEAAQLTFKALNFGTRTDISSQELDLNFDFKDSRRPIAFASL